MRETIRMKMRLLDGRAEDEQDGAQDGEHKSLACPVPAHSLHDYRILYAGDLRFLLMALPAKSEPGINMTNRIAPRVVVGRPSYSA